MMYDEVVRDDEVESRAHSLTSLSQSNQSHLKQSHHRVNQCGLKELGD